MSSIYTNLYCFSVIIINMANLYVSVGEWLHRNHRTSYFAKKSLLHDLMRQFFDLQNKVLTDIEFRKYRYSILEYSILEDNLFDKLQMERMVITLLCYFCGSISDRCSSKKKKKKERNIIFI